MVIFWFLVICENTYIITINQSIPWYFLVDKIVAVVGPTGVGKSSFCNLISGVGEQDEQVFVQKKKYMYSIFLKKAASSHPLFWTNKIYL